MAKETFTYATERKVKEKAAKKAKREKLTLSEKIDQMLRAYIKPEPKNSVFGDVYGPNGKFSDDDSED